MTVKCIEIQFLQCDFCGEHAPTVFDSDGVDPANDGALALDAAREQGWRLLTTGDACPECIDKQHGRSGLTLGPEVLRRPVSPEFIEALRQAGASTSLIDAILKANP